MSNDLRKPAQEETQTASSELGSRKGPGAPAPRLIAAQKNKQDELLLLVNSRHPIITIATTEESRAENLLLEVATRLDVPLYIWSVTTGLARMKGAPLYNSETPEQALTNLDIIHGDAIFVLKDFARYCENDKVCRRLRELAEKFRAERRSIVITGAAVTLPADLSGEAIPFAWGLPTAEELMPAVKTVLAQMNLSHQIAIALDSAGTTQLARNLVGLPQDEAIRTLRMCVLERRRIDRGLLDDVVDAKRQLLRSAGLLETVRRDSSFRDVAGLDRLRKWIAKRKSALTPEGRSFGLEPPKGVLITGVQGCGKSLAARAIAGEWGFELARLDAGALYDKFVGESEKRLDKALELAQKLSPMVLWIDEIEKAFASAGSSGDADAGLSQRLVATLLTWMQDRESGVFLAATSNNISLLPPEMLRKGRFDEIFFVDLPKAEARTALFALHLGKRARDAATFDLPSLAQASEGFSGAEIEQVIVAGLYTAFETKQQLSTEILVAEIAVTRPLSVTRSEDVDRIREWARTRAVPAD
ncbi:MAG TPA: AAA family ATPase [Candidatus Saccharimonadales bacterium]|nr:AAA family ATPase [Candidatus Saccharimonadales bacterium]